MKKKAFTLAEVMIVLTVIGILSAILLPVAINSTPDKNILKFKKGYNTLTSVIRELVSSDKYYLNGDLGVKHDGNLVDSATYFCETFADVISIQSKNCSTSVQAETNPHYNAWFSVKTIGFVLSQLDYNCKNNKETLNNEIISSDNISFYEKNTVFHFGTLWDAVSQIITPTGLRLFGDFKDDAGFDKIYKYFCMDIDGIPEGASKDDCINECPFGFGIRADGKILTGARADEWLKKEITSKD